MPRPQNRKVRSSCWYFYDKTTEGGICKICNKDVRSTGNTTNLLNHLKRRHPNEFRDNNHTDYVEENYGDHEGMSPSSAQHHENEDATRNIEPHQGGSTMEAYQADQGGTVIWLESAADGHYAPPNHQSQLTIVRHMDQNGEGEQGEREGGHHESGEGNPAQQQQHGPSEENNPSENSPPKQGGEPQRKPHHGKMLRPRPMTRFQSNYANTRNRVPSPAVPPVTSQAPKFDDPFEAFGRYVAALLRNLHSKKGAYRLQKEIIWQILQEQMREC